MVTMTNNDELALILVAAGSSARIGFDKTGSKIKKEYLAMNGGTVLSCAAKAFLSTLKFSTVVVTYPIASNDADLKASEQKLHAPKQPRLCVIEKRTSSIPKSDNVFLK